MEITDIIVVCFALVFSAFFSGMEIAYLSANKLKLELEIKKKTFTSKLLQKITNEPSEYISAILLGNNIALVIYGVFMANLIVYFLGKFLYGEFIILLVQTLISTLIILFFAEFLPKTLFRTVSNKALKFFVLPLTFFFFLFRPLVHFTIWLSKFLLKNILRIKIDEKSEEKAFGKIDIIDIIEESQNYRINDKTNQELKLIQNALDFSKIKLRECIIPRGDLAALSYDSEIEDVIRLFVKTGYSNILIYKHNIDEIIGYVNIKDIFKRPQTVRAVLREIMIVPETMSAKKLLEQLIDNNKSLAVVVDEFGGTGGIVTVEDIMEEIFGDIEDEHDNYDLVAKITQEGNYLLSGRNEVDLINEEFNLNLSESDEYETIAGYILYRYGDFPKEGEIIELKDNNTVFKFKILKIQDTKIEKILLYS